MNILESEKASDGRNQRSSLVPDFKSPRAQSGFLSLKKKRNPTSRVTKKLTREKLLVTRLAPQRKLDLHLKERKKV